MRIEKPIVKIISHASLPKNGWMDSSFCKAMVKEAQDKLLEKVRNEIDVVKIESSSPNREELEFFLFIVKK